MKFLKPSIFMKKIKTFNLTKCNLSECFCIQCQECLFLTFSMLIATYLILQFNRFLRANVKPVILQFSVSFHWLGIETHTYYTCMSTHTKKESL